jgi:hypothetical protein
MSEQYNIVSQARGEPRPAGCVGARVRVRLSGVPSRPWCYTFAGRLVSELTGHGPVGHLRVNINDIVQGDQIVLEGVERSEASALAEPLHRAIEAANQAVGAEPNRTHNMSQRAADAVAGQIFL